MSAGPVHYCWACYAGVDSATGRCPVCGGSVAAPPGTSYADQLLWALRHPLVERRIVAAHALAERGERRAVEPLVAMMEDPDPYLAAAAVSALGRLDPERAGPLLRRLAKGGSAPVRLAARMALEEST